jgi:hypothetical protein
MSVLSTSPGEIRRVSTSPRLGTLGLCSMYGGGAYAKSIVFARKVSTTPKPFGWRIPPPRSGTAGRSGRFEQEYRASPGRGFLTGRPASLRHDMIRDAAYFRAQARGFVSGKEIEDWLAAEQDIGEQCPD